MKTFKSTKQRALASPQKSETRDGHAVDRERSISRPNDRARHMEAGRPASHARAKTGHQSLASPNHERLLVNVPYQTAVKNFETAVRAFQKQNYQKAAEIFEKLIQNDARDVAERANVH